MLPELCKSILLEKLIGLCLSLQFFQNFRPFPFIFLGVEIALVPQTLTIVQALLREAF